MALMWSASSVSRLVGNLVKASQSGELIARRLHQQPRARRRNCPRGSSKNASFHARKPRQLTACSTSYQVHRVDFASETSPDHHLHGDGNEAQPTTTYEVEVVTSIERGSGLSEPAGGILLNFVHEDGTAVLRRFGANNHRFQQGSVDSFAVEAPSTSAQLAALWIAPQSGKWRPERVSIKRGGQDHIDVFRCGELLGDGAKLSAAELKPVRVSLSDTDPQHTAELLQIARLQGLSDYQSLKQRLLVTDVSIALAGSVIAGILGGTDVARSFGMGANAGLIYLLLLEKSVDALPGGSHGGRSMNDLASRVQNVINSTPARVAAVAALLLFAARGWGEGASVTKPQLVAAVLGFLTYKVAVLVTAATTPAGNE
eukprot:jgi/Chlat1/7364/Chrsp59S06979